MNKFQKKALAGLVSHPVKWDCLLSQYTSFSIGGPAHAVVLVDKKDELSALLKFFMEEKLQWRVIGKGTNLLIKDGGFPGVILLLGEEFQSISDCFKLSHSDVGVKVGGGCGLGRFSSICMERGLAGMEFTCSIPGTIGGAVIMNAGAWGCDMGSVIERITLVSARGEIIREKEDLNFGYRCWYDYLRGGDKAVVAEVEFRLIQAEPEKIKAYCQALRRKRVINQPNSSASAGSFFKNPVNDSAGRLIEASGFKGKTIGGAMVSEKHANFLVNCGGATAADVLALMGTIQMKVKRDSGINLEPEVHIL